MAVAAAETAAYALATVSSKGPSLRQILNSSKYGNIIEQSE
jgi:hypothetical protein